MAEVSIIVPSYNHGSFIAAAIQSVLDQDFQDTEVIVVDDASSDNSAEIVARLTDPRIKLVRLPKNNGGAAALNIGISQASGQFLAICNSDDLWERGKLRAQVDLLRSAPELAAVFTSAKWIDETGKRLPDYKCPGFSDVFRQENRSRAAWIRRLVEHGNCLCHPSVLIRRDIFQKVGPYNNMLRQLPDYEMWLRLTSQHDIFVMPEEYVCFRQHANNASRLDEINSLRSHREYLMIMQDLFDRMDNKVFLESFGHAQGDTDGGLIDRTRFLLSAEGPMGPALKSVGAALAFRIVGHNPALSSAFDHNVIHDATVGGTDRFTAPRLFPPTFRNSEDANAAGCKAFAENRPQDALHCFEAALRLSPNFGAARQNLCIAAAALGHAEPALELARTGHQELSSEVLKIAFHASIDTAEVSLAADILKRLSLSEPADSLTQLYARLCTARGDHEAALFNAAQAVSDTPQSLEARSIFVDTLAKFVAGQGQAALCQWYDAAVRSSNSAQRSPGGPGTVAHILRHRRDGRQWKDLAPICGKRVPLDHVPFNLVLDPEDFHDQTSFPRNQGAHVVLATPGWLNTIAGQSQAEYLALAETSLALPEHWANGLLNRLQDDTTCLMAIPALVGVALHSPFLRVTSRGILQEADTSRRSSVEVLHAGAVSSLPLLPNVLCGVLHRASFLALGGVRQDLFPSETAQFADAALRGLQAGYAIRLDSAVIGKITAAASHAPQDLLGALMTQHAALPVLLSQFGPIVDPALQLSRAKHSQNIRHHR